MAAPAPSGAPPALPPSNPGQLSGVVREAGTPKTSTYRSPPVAWMQRFGSTEPLLQVALLAVILTALVAMACMALLTTVVIIRLL